MRQIVPWLFFLFICSVILHAFFTRDAASDAPPTAGGIEVNAQRDIINNANGAHLLQIDQQGDITHESKRRESTDSRAVLQKGWYIEGRLPDATKEIKTSVFISAAAVDPSDALEITDPERAGDLWNFTNYQFIAVTNGTFGPFWVDAAEGYCIVGSVGGREVRWRAAAPQNIAFGSKWNVGILESVPSTSLEIQLSGPANITIFQLKIARLTPSDAGSRKFHELHTIDRALAEAVYNGSEIAIKNNSTTTLRRLPDAGEWELVLVSPTGIEAKPRRVFLHEGQKTNITIQAESSFTAAELLPATIRGIIQFETGEAAGNVHVSGCCARISARTSADGSFILTNAPRGRDISLVITNFDAARPEREFTYTTFVEPAQAGHTVVIRIPLQRWVSARGLEKPWGLPYEEPIAFFIEKLNGEDWTLYNSIEFKQKADGVDAAVDADDTTYRIGALWTPLFIQYSMPATIPKGNTNITTAFLPIQSAGAVSGFIVNESKQKEPDAFIEIQGPIAGVPPIELRSGGAGDFRAFPANVAIATLRCHSKSGSAEVEIKLPLEKPLQVVVHH